MPVGSPCSHPFCAFHGRSEAFSGSAVVLQPAKTKVVAASRMSSLSTFISVKDLIALFDVTELPPWQHAGDAALFHDLIDSHFAHELAVAMNHEHAAFKNLLLGANVQDDEIPLGIDRHDAAPGPGRQ